LHDEEEVVEHRATNQESHNSCLGEVFED
jgi:hypothetical protein